MPPKIAYIMSRFPHLPETFILREMNALEQIGWQVSLYPLIKQHQNIIHAEAEHWLSRANYTPYLSPQIILENLRSILKVPERYLGLIRRVIRESFSNWGFLIRSITLFPKAVYLARIMQQEGIRHIHAHYATYPALVAWIIHQLTGIPYSITAHAHDIFVSHTMLKTKLCGATFIVAISKFNRKYLAENIDSTLEEKTHIVHCGVDPSWYQAQQDFDKGERFEILNISSLQAYKGQIYLLQACRNLRDRGVNFRCRIIGEGEERQALESYIHVNQLQDQVELLGALSQDKVAWLLPKAHCYVQPSVITLSGKMEGIPVALMEALASQLPVVATEISGIPEIIKPGETGYLVPPNDSVALADALQAVSNNREHAKIYGQNGRKLVIEKFNLAKNAALLASLFDEFVIDEQFKK